MNLVFGRDLLSAPQNYLLNGKKNYLHGTQTTLGQWLIRVSVVFGARQHKIILHMVENHMQHPFEQKDLRLVNTPTILSNAIKPHWCIRAAG